MNRENKRIHNESLCEYLRAYFRRVDGTQTKAAKRLGLSSAFISLVVTGKKRPNQAILDDVGIIMEVVTTTQINWRFKA